MSKINVNGLEIETEREIKSDEIIAKEFEEHGELMNKLKLLHYGVILLEAQNRIGCSLSELLNGINLASQRMIGDHNFNTP
jgi:hypothetical protein